MLTYEKTIHTEEEINYYRQFFPEKTYMFIGGIFPRCKYIIIFNQEDDSVVGGYSYCKDMEVVDRLLYGPVAVYIFKDDTLAYNLSKSKVLFINEYATATQYLGNDIMEDYLTCIMLDALDENPNHWVMSVTDNKMVEALDSCNVAKIEGEANLPSRYLPYLYTTTPGLFDRNYHENKSSPFGVDPVVSKKAIEWHRKYKLGDYSLCQHNMWEKLVRGDLTLEQLTSGEE